MIAAQVNSTLLHNATLRNQTNTIDVKDDHNYLTITNSTRLPLPAQRPCYLSQDRDYRSFSQTFKLMQVVLQKARQGKSSNTTLEDGALLTELSKLCDTDYLATTDLAVDLMEISRLGGMLAPGQIVPQLAKYHQTRRPLVAEQLSHGKPLKRRKRFIGFLLAFAFLRGLKQREAMRRRHLLLMQEERLSRVIVNTLLQGRRVPPWNMRTSTAPCVLSGKHSYANYKLITEVTETLSIGLDMSKGPQSFQDNIKPLLTRLKYLCPKDKSQVLYTIGASLYATKWAGPLGSKENIAVTYAQYTKYNATTNPLILSRHKREVTPQRQRVARALTSRVIATHEQTLQEARRAREELLKQLHSFKNIGSVQEDDDYLDGEEWEKQDINITAQELAKVASAQRPYNPDDPLSTVGDMDKQDPMLKDIVSLSREQPLKSPSDTLKEVLEKGREKIRSVVHNATGSLITPVGVAAISPSSVYIPLVQTITVPQWNFPEERSTDVRRLCAGLRKPERCIRILDPESLQKRLPVHSGHCKRDEHSQERTNG